MFESLFLIISVQVIHGLPMDMIVKSVSESAAFDHFDNYIPRYDNLPNFSQPNISDSLNEVNNIPNISSPAESFNILTEDSPTTISDSESKSIESTKLFDLDDGKTIKSDEGNPKKSKPEKDVPIMINSSDEGIKENTVTTERTQMTEIISTFNISDIDISFNETARNPREESEKDDPEFADKDSKELSEQEEDEEEDMNMITGILSALLGGLSKPDGSIDLDAIVGLIGSLSTVNDNGTYDFSGLTQLLKGFFGGTGEGGSDVGAFAGGLIGAIIQGIANPPGGKGVGILTAKLVAGILPTLSVQPPDPDMMGGNPWVKPGGLDIGGFLSGFLKTFLSASSGGDVNPVQFLISTISSLSNSKPQQQPEHQPKK